MQLKANRIRLVKPLWLISNAKRRDRVIVGPQKRITIRPTKAKIITLSKKARKIVRSRKIKTIWPTIKTSLDKELREMGWGKEKDGYRGRVKGNRVSYEAKLFWEGRNFYDFLIRKPSQRVLNGRYKNCIHRTSNGWWRVHFSNGSDNPLGQIYKVQEYLREVGE